jgi:hypothetical protein
MPAFSPDEISPQELDNLVLFPKELRNHPETSVGADIGTEQAIFKDHHTVGLTYFYNRF